MGFFSWLTQDTDRSISNVHSSRGAFTVYMTDNKGNVWKEDSYNGYGVFGGKDFYQLLAEMNNCEGLTGEAEKDRDIGIDLWFSGKQVLAPNLAENPEWVWQLAKPVDCDCQGFFYDAASI